MGKIKGFVKKTPLISVLIPIYNVEKYLRQCLDSVVAQTLTNIEIICINDGSTDNSLEIINEYAANDTRIAVIDKPNSGYGHSMNVGIKAAKGKYIGIVESDDFVNAKMFETLYDNAEKFGADAVKSNFYLYWSQPVERYELFEYSRMDECGRLLSPSSHENGSMFTRKPSIWSAIYRRSFLQEYDIDFLETPGAAFQDTSFTFKVFTHTERIVFIHDAFLYYRQDNENSSIHSPKTAYAVIDEYKEIESFVRTLPGKNKAKMEAIKNKAFYDTSIWNYERLIEPLRYPYLVRIQPWLQEIIDNNGLEYKYFEPEWWKWRDFHRIAKDPMEYHTWRHVERYENSGGLERHDESLKILDRTTYNTPYFSIIVPVYNVEKYLRSCLASLIYQTFDDIEIICVNDGSTDRSLSILAEFQSYDERIIVIDKPNGGLSSARNAGMAAAKGKHILFVDSDDWISIETCEKLKGAAERNNNTDIIVFGANPFPDEPTPSEWLRNVLSPPDEFYQSVGMEVILTKPYLSVFVWRYCVRRDFISLNDLRFDEQCLYGEDVLFAFEAFPKAKGVLVISDELYRYRHHRADSLMGSVRNDPATRPEKQLDILQKTLDIYKKNTAEASPELLAYALDFMYGVINDCIEPDKEKYSSQFYSLLQKENLIQYIDLVAENYKGFYRCLESMHGEYNATKILKYKLKRLFVKLKTMLKKILPPSRISFHMRMDNIMTQLERLENKVNLLEWQNSELLKKNDNNRF